MFFRLSDQSRGLAFSFGWNSNITANFQVPLCQATARGGEGQEGRWWQGEGGCCCVVLCCWPGGTERKERVLPEARRSTPGKIHLLLALSIDKEGWNLWQRGTCWEGEWKTEWCGLSPAQCLFSCSFFHWFSFPQCPRCWRTRCLLILPMSGCAVDVYL